MIKFVTIQHICEHLVQRNLSLMPLRGRFAARLDSASQAVVLFEMVEPRRKQIGGDNSPLRGPGGEKTYCSQKLPALLARRLVRRSLGEGGSFSEGGIRG